jgi:hypothetical protein
MLVKASCEQELHEHVYGASWNKDTNAHYSTEAPEVLKIRYSLVDTVDDKVAM